MAFITQGSVLAPALFNFTSATYHSQPADSLSMLMIYSDDICCAFQAKTSVEIVCLESRHCTSCQILPPVAPEIQHLELDWRQWQARSTCWTQLQTVSYKYILEWRVPEAWCKCCLPRHHFGSYTLLQAVLVIYGCEVKKLWYGSLISKLAGTIWC